MSDSEIHAYVDGLADRVPHVDAPLAGVLAAGRASVARRRRRRGAALAVGAVVAVAAVLVAPRVLVHQAPVDDGRGAGPAASSPSELAAPDGTRYVGTDGVVVAVPSSWVSAHQSICPGFGPTVASFVLVEPEVSPARCPHFSSTPEVAAQVLIGRTDSDNLRGACGDGCERLRLDSIVFDVRIPASYPGRADVLATMRTSLRRVPAGWATVPLWPNETTEVGRGATSYGPASESDYRAVLDRAGLSEVVRVLDAEQRLTDPAQGTVVALPAAQAAPEGARYVGAEDYVIAVPDSWTRTFPDPCSALLPDRTWAVADRRPLLDPATAEQQAKECQVRVDATEPGPDYEVLTADETLTVTIGPLEILSIGGADDPTPMPRRVTSNGVELVRSTSCSDVDCQATWTVDGADVSFSVQVPPRGGQRLLDEMEASIRRLPAGWTTSAETGLVVRD